MACKAGGAFALAPPAAINIFVVRALRRGATAAAEPNPELRSMEYSVGTRPSNLPILESVFGLVSSTIVPMLQRTMRFVGGRFAREENTPHQPTFSGRGGFSTKRRWK